MCLSCNKFIYVALVYTIVELLNEQQENTGLPNTNEKGTPLQLHLPVTNQLNQCVDTKRKDTQHNDRLADNSRNNAMHERPSTGWCRKTEALDTVSRKMPLYCYQQ